jgi:hypothetical protein
VDPSQIVAIVTAIIAGGAAVVAAVIGGIFSFRTYPNQKKADREEEERKARATAYSGLLVAYAETERWYGVSGQEDKFAEAFLKYSQAYSALFNVANNNVINPTSRFHEFVWVRTPNGQLSNADWETQWRNLYATMLVAMRNDAFVGQNDVGVDDILQRLPWYFQWNAEDKAQARFA